jgi:hypothetical protein
MAWLLLMLSTAPVRAQIGIAPNDIERVGQSGWQFLKINGDPRQAAMGGAFTAISHGDANAVFGNAAALDEMIDWILSADTDFVVDNGAASFLPLSRYLVENDIPGLIADHGKRVAVHTIVTGGPAMLETAKGLAAIVGQYPADVDIVVWLNAFFGPIVTAAGDGFEKTPLYQQTRHRIASLVRLDALSPDTFGHTLAQMLDRRLTFAEAEASAEFLTVARRRLQQIKRSIWTQLAHVV